MTDRVVVIHRYPRPGPLRLVGAVVRWLPFGRTIVTVFTLLTAFVAVRAATPDYDVPWVPFASHDCEPDQVPQEPGATSVAFKAGSMLSTLRDGAPSVAAIRESLLDTAADAGQMWGEVKVGWDGMTLPGKQPEDDDGGTRAIAACGPCPTDEVRPALHSPGPELAATAALAAGWTGEDAVTAVAVAAAESGYRPDAANTTSTARGMWQTMMSYHAPKYAPGESWRDPYANARVAYEIYQSQGWGAWVAHTNGAYRAHLDEARDAVAAAGGGVCAPGASYGSVVYPVAKSTDRENYGASGPSWSRGHTGTDFSVGCGTPVKAAHAGTVQVETDQGWSGRWLVKVSTGEGKLTTWYAHMQALDVAAGDPVAAGQVLGEVGTEGNSTGCHLHFEVHPKGGGIYEDGVDPSVWLAGNVGNRVTGDGFTLASFNVLGTTHTAPGGKRAAWPAGEDRIRRAAALMVRHGVDVAGLQEFQVTQQRVFRRTVGSTYGMFGDRDNVVVWRKSDWSLVAGDTVGIPYFDGNTRQMPVVKLRSRSTGQVVVVVNVHNPAHPENERHRETATRIELNVVKQLRKQGAPVFLVGDLNEREEGCRVAQSSGLTVSAGGCGAGTIDWIFGTVPFGGHQVVRTGRVSDHPMIVAEVTGPGATV